MLRKFTQSTFSHFTIFSLVTLIQITIFKKIKLFIELNKMLSINKYNAKDHQVFELSISLFFSIVSLGVVRFYICARTGFDISYADINNISGISLFILLCPCVISAFEIKYLNKNRSQQVGFNALITLLSIAFLIICSYLVGEIGYWLLSFIAIIGYNFLLVTIYLSISSFKYTQWLILILGSLLMLIWVAGRVFSYSNYHNPLFLENLAVGITQMDTLFHASVMQMIKTYGIPSTGLDGTPYLNYHWGSHWLLARFSILINTSAITTYNLIYPALFVCLYFKTSLIFAYDVFRQLYKRTKPIREIGIIFWFFFLVTQVGFMPTSFLYNWAVWDSWIESESYSISLLFFYLYSSIALSSYNLYVNKLKSLVNPLFILLTLLFPTLGLFKISTLLIALTVLLYIYIRFKLFNIYIYNFYIIIILCLSYYVIKITSSFTTKETEDFYVFHFFKTYTLSNWKGVFYYIHYFWAILYIVLRFRSAKFSNLKEAFFNNQFIDVELLVIISLSGLLPASLINIDGGSAYYFTDIQSRIAVSFIMAFIIFDISHTDFVNFEQKVIVTFFKKYALLLPLIAILTLSNIFSKFEDAVNLNFQNRLSFIQSYDGNKGYLNGVQANILLYTSGKKSEIYSKLSQLKRIPFEGLRSSHRYSFLKNLTELDNLDLQKKRNLAIFVPPTSEWFWQKSLENIYATPFIIPALSGISSVGGLPKGVSPESFTNYGYATYSPVLNKEYYKTFSVENICDHTREIHLHNKSILILNTEVSRTDTLNCHTY